MEVVLFVVVFFFELMYSLWFFFFSSRRRHTRWTGDWSSDVCSSDLPWMRPPCRAIAPALEELATDSKGTVSLAKVNVDDSPALAARYGIRSIPTILFMKEGKVVDQVIGAVPKSQLKKKLDSLA